MSSVSELARNLAPSTTEGAIRQSNGDAAPIRLVFTARYAKQALDVDLRNLDFLEGWPRQCQPKLEVTFGPSLKHWLDDHDFTMSEVKDACARNNIPIDYLTGQEPDTGDQMEFALDDPRAPIPDSGDRSQFKTGAQRDAMVGKGLPSLIPPAALRSLAKRFEDGAIKYTRLNWLKGIPLSRFQDAIMRHTLAAAEGQTDEDHFGAIMWNAAAWLETDRRIQSGELPAELNDLPYVQGES